MTNIAHLDTAALDTAAKFFRAMQKAGVNFTGPMQSVAKRRNLAAYLEMGCPKLNGNGEVLTLQLPEGEDMCRLILGDDFVTPELMVNACGWNYNDEQVEHFAENLPDLEELMWLRTNGYMLMPGPQTDLNLLQVRELDNQLLYSKSGGWYSEEKQGRSPATVQTDVATAGEWLKIRKDPYPNSRNQKWVDQEKLLTDIEHVPNIAQVSYAVTAYYKVRGVYLLPNVYVRTSSVGAGGDRVYCGGFGHDGLVVSSRWDDNRYSYLGVSSARS